MFIKERFKEQREGLGYTQREVAEQIGVKLTTLRAWEYKGAVPRDLSGLKRLGFDISYIKGKSDEIKGD